MKLQSSLSFAVFCYICVYIYFLKLMKRIYILLFCLHFFIQNFVAQNYRTQAINEDIHSIEVTNNGQWDSYPLMQLNSEDEIMFDFDLVSDNLLAPLRYKLIYCNADWTENTSLSQLDYLDGYDDNLINNYETSLNTTVSYTHYSLKIPNTDVRPKISGNYAILIYDEDLGDGDIFLTACFSVIEPKVSLFPTVSSITDIDANAKHQQVSFDLKYDFFISDVQNDLKVFVRQNDRLDNEKKNIKPTYIQPSNLKYEYNKNLIFEAGNEYKRFDMSSYRSNGMNVAHIDYVRPYYNMYITPSQIKINPSYSYDQDQNGRVIYRNLDGGDVNTEGDYFYTHFTLLADEPLLQPIYINGAFTDNTFTDKYKMVYDRENREYNLTLLLKQGIYNYQYLTFDGQSYSTGPIAGNFYETENEYAIYVYYRPPGQLYDSFIGFSRFQSRQK